MLFCFCFGLSILDALMSTSDVVCVVCFFSPSFAISKHGICCEVSQQIPKAKE